MMLLKKKKKNFSLVAETLGKTNSTAERKMIGEKSGIDLIEFDKFVQVQRNFPG